LYPAHRLIVLKLRLDINVIDFKGGQNCGEGQGIAGLTSSACFKLAIATDDDYCF
jgi:hypothetical protein